MLLINYLINSKSNENDNYKNDINLNLYKPVLLFIKKDKNKISLSTETLNSVT